MLIKESGQWTSLSGFIPQEIISYDDAWQMFGLAYFYNVAKLSWGAMTQEGKSKRKVIKE